MSVPEGYIGNLTSRQTVLLHQCWKLFLEYLSDPNAHDSKKTKTEEPIFPDDSNLVDIVDSSQQGSSQGNVTYSSSGVAISFWDHTVAGEDPDVLLLRFLRARKWNLENAIDMLIKTVEWRWYNNLTCLMRHGETLISKDLLTGGKIFFYKRDLNNRPVCYMDASKHDKNAQTAQDMCKFTVYVSEMARRLIIPPAETITLVFDLSNFRIRNMDYESLKFVAQCFQNYYPESLGVLLVLNAPMIFWGCWTVIKQFVDPVVVQKVNFISKDQLSDYIKITDVPKDFGGRAETLPNVVPNMQEMTDAQLNSEQQLLLQRLKLAEQLQDIERQIISKMGINEDSGSGISMEIPHDAELDQLYEKKTKVKSAFRSNWLELQKVRPRVMYDIV